MPRPPTTAPHHTHPLAANTERSIVDLTIEEAFLRTAMALKPEFSHLPPPIQLRAAGVTEAWQRARAHAGAAGHHLTEQLAAPEVMPQRWPELQAQFIDQHFTKDTREGFWRAGKALSVNGSYWLAFGLRHGALYEPTAALHRLLEATDVGPDIPLRLILPPSPALCIVPPPSVRDAPDGFRAVTVFDSPVPSGPGAPPRCLTFIIETARRTDTLTVAVHGGDETMADGFALACERITFLLSKSQDLDVEQECRIALRQLTYVAKLLLYMSLDAAAVRLDRTYTDADRSFSGLGRRKREQRQAQIELLYDRYVVGPAVLADGAASSAGDHAGTEISAHWRRGHFRMQSHGPQSSLRKLMFIAPTLVRPDRLPEL